MALHFLVADVINFAPNGQESLGRKGKDMNFSIRLRLSIMMFLQYAIWGAWAPVLSGYLEKELGFAGGQLGMIYSLLHIACIISPFLGGQIADRYLPTQWMLAALQFVGGIILWIMGSFNEYSPIFYLMLIYAFLYTPTLALTNSISFHHLDDPERQFGGIRVWGTIGWIIANWILSIVRYALPPIHGDCLRLAGVISIIMGIFCVFLPHTPPRKEAESPWAFVEAFKLMKDRNFLVFILISFVVATELQFYYVLTAPFLMDLGIARKNVPWVMTIAQIAEIITMAWALKYFLPRLGVRWCLTIGIIAWPIRYIIFAIGQPWWLVVASLTLHGLCYVFFFTVGQIYTNSVASDDIRASAQSLITLVTLGVGSTIGCIFAGEIKEFFTTTVEGKMVTNYTAVFLVPCFLTIACAVAFLIWFRPEGREAPAELDMKPRTN